MSIGLLLACPTRHWHRWRLLWELLTIGRVTAVITFHEPVTLETTGGRKAMSTHCYAEISRRLEYLNSGYDPVEHAA